MGINDAIPDEATGRLDPETALLAPEISLPVDAARPEDERWAGGVVGPRPPASVPALLATVVGGTLIAAWWLTGELDSGRALLRKGNVGVLLLLAIGTLVGVAITAEVVRRLRDWRRSRRARLALHTFPLVAGEPLEGVVLLPRHPGGRTARVRVVCWGITQQTFFHRSTDEHHHGRVYEQDDAVPRVRALVELDVPLRDDRPASGGLGAFAIPFGVRLPDGRPTGPQALGDVGDSLTSGAWAYWELRVDVGDEPTVAFPLPVVAKAGGAWRKDASIGALPRAPAPAGPDPRCPRCGQADLEPGAGALGGAGCSQCGGVFLEAGVTEDVLERIGVDRPMAGELLREASAPGVRCPGCGQPARELQLKGTRVDLCAGCGGLWLDADEVVPLTR